MQSRMPGSALLRASASILQVKSHFRETRLPFLTRGFRKAGLSCVCSNARPPGCCHSAAVPHMLVPDFLPHGASCGSSFVAASSAPPSSEPRHRGKPKIRTGTCSEGKLQNASRPAQASENCKRGHELKALELARRRKKV